MFRYLEGCQATAACQLPIHVNLNLFLGFELMLQTIIFFLRWIYGGAKTVNLCSHVPPDQIAHRVKSAILVILTMDKRTIMWFALHNDGFASSWKQKGCLGILPTSKTAQASLRMKCSTIILIYYIFLFWTRGQQKSILFEYNSPKAHWVFPSFVTAFLTSARNSQSTPQQKLEVEWLPRLRKMSIIVVGELVNKAEWTSPRAPSP